MSQVATTHPDYAERNTDWTIVRDAAAGQTPVKIKNKEYLPVPGGFLVESDRGGKSYDAYITRAQFPEYFSPTVRGMSGIITSVPPKIELPTALEHLRDKATPDGLTLVTFYRRIVSEILTTGRYGVLGDFPVDGGESFLAGYQAENIINWSSDRDLFVLDESAPVREPDGFEWKDNKRFRALMLKDGAYQITLFDESEGTDENGAELSPTSLGDVPLDFIPFVVVGSTDLSPDPDEIPLLEVARAAFAEYRLDADLRHQLYMSGQETLFISNVNEEQLPSVIGSSVIHALPENAVAEYVGPSGVGIEAHERAIASERMKALNAGAKMFEQSDRASESGESRKVRMVAQTATLLSIAQTSAAGLEMALKHLATWSGANPDEVSVTPSLKFVETTLAAADAVNLMKLWMGGVISKQTLYENLQRGEIASQERDFEEEEDLIELEPPDLGEGDVDEVNAEGDDDDDDNDDQGGRRPAEADTTPIVKSKLPGMVDLTGELW